MRTVAFDGAGLGVSRLGFGCAPVMGKVGKRQALDAMACALDLGVTHFDIARSYGFGDAETVLGQFLRGRRDRVTVASKFGIVPPVLSRTQRLARPVVRPLLKVLAPFRKKVRAASAGLLAERRFDLGYARQCLETSLRNLRTERIDIYLLHEPDLDVIDGASDLLAFLDESVSEGRIRAWGMAHPHAHAAEAANAAGGQVLQFEAPASSPDAWVPASRDGRFMIATRPLGGGALARDASRARLAQELGLDPLQFAMAWALAAVGEQGALVAGMFDREHIAQNVKAVEHGERQGASLANALAAAGLPVRHGTAAPTLRPR